MSIFGRPKFRRAIPFGLLKDESQKSKEVNDTNDFDEYDEYDKYDEYDDDSDEFLSVYEAAEIWASHGKDEDYMFGYTEEELEDAL